MNASGLLATLAAGAGLLAGASASAASFTVSTSNAYPGPATQWNPRVDDGLLAATSKAADYFSTISYPSGGGIVKITQEGLAAAAAYGSDTSAGGGLLDPRLKGLAIEPMADTQAAARRVCTYDGDPFSCSGNFSMYAGASASVAHRIVQRAVPDISPQLQAILDSLGQVPVRLDYALSATASNPEAPYASVATAAFSVLQGSTTLVSRKACASAVVSSNCTSVGEEHNTWVDVLERSTADRTVTYTINAGAGSMATNYLASDGSWIEAQAVADPFLYVDPAWEYAPYFVVEQESTLVPGTWAEVTRVWMQPVPEPRAWSLMLAGLAAVGGLARRRPQGQVGRFAPDRDLARDTMT
jgi:hypothetical protein